MGHQEWHERYVSVLTAYVQRPSEDLSRRAAGLGESLLATHAAPEEVVATHMACVEELCATGAHADTNVWRAATPLLLEIMKAYGRCLQEAQGRPRQRAEQALRESEEQLRLVADNVTALITYVGSDRRYRFVNKQYEISHGLATEEIIGKHVRDLLGDANYQLIEQHIDAALSGQRVNYEAPIVYADSKTRWISAAYVPHKDHTGCTIGFYALINDITERKQAEELLRESEQRYRALFEQAADAILLVDGDTGGLVEFNDRAHERLGYTREEFRKLKIADIEVVESPEEIARHIAAIYKSGAEVFETKHRTKTGEIRNVLVNSRVIPVGQKLLFQTIWTDITERKRAEEALRESEKRYRQLFESLNDAALLADIETGRIVETNRQGELLLARPRNEIVGMHHSDLHLPEEADKYKRLFANHIEKGHAAAFDAEVIRKDGAIVPVTISASTLSVGGHRLILGLFRDVTERKRAEQALRESEARYRQLFAAVSDAIMVFDADTKQFVDVNDAALRLYGYSKEEFLKLLHPEITVEQEESSASIEQTLAGKLMRIPLRYHKKKDGTVFPVEISASTLTLGNRRLLCGVVRDITERKRSEEDARQRQAELAHVSRLTLVGEMASSLSHDISQPLATILFYARGCIRRMRSGTADPTALMDVMEKVAAQAEAAGRIVGRLREFVSKRAPHLSTVDINDVIRQALSLVQSEISAGGITVRLQTAESLPPVRADRIQIEQVILNLVRNGIEALQAVEAGRRELTIETSSSAGDTITVAVHDTGTGLSAEVAERVFDSFFSTKPDGMGMGLSISRSIIEVHEGRLWVVPNAERGATFQFSLPVMRGAADEEA